MSETFAFLMFVASAVIVSAFCGQLLIRLFRLR